MIFPNTITDLTQTTMIDLFKFKDTLEKTIDNLSNRILESDPSIASALRATPTTPDLKTRLSPNLTNHLLTTSTSAIISVNGRWGRAPFISLNRMTQSLRLAVNVEIGFEQLFLVMVLMSTLLATSVAVFLNLKSDPWEEIIDFYSEIESQVSQNDAIEDSTSILYERDKLEEIEMADDDPSTEDLSPLSERNFEVRPLQSWLMLQPDETIQQDETKDNDLSLKHSCPSRYDLDQFTSTLFTFTDKSTWESKEFHAQLLNYLPEAAKGGRTSFYGDLVSKKKLKLLRFVVSNDYTGNLTAVAEYMLSVRRRIRRYHSLILSLLPIIEKDTRTEMLYLLISGWVFGIFDKADRNEMITLLESLMVLIELPECQAEATRALCVIPATFAVEDAVAVFQTVSQKEKGMPDEFIIFSAFARSLSFYIFLNERKITQLLGQNPTMSQENSPAVHLLFFVRQFFRNVSYAAAVASDYRTSSFMQLSTEMAKLYESILQVILESEIISPAVLLEILNMFIIPIHRLLRSIDSSYTSPEPGIGNISCAS